MNRYCLRRDPVRAVFGFVCAACLAATEAQPQATLDPTFTPSLNGFVSTLATQPDGRVLVGGSFTTVNGAPRPYLARLNADGSLDTSFAINNGPAQFVSRVAVVGGKVYAAASDGLRRFSANGALDWHYPQNVATFAIDAQNRVVMGGQFTRLEHRPHRNIARLTAAGALDTTFNAQVGCCAGEGVHALATLGDSILAGGLFQSVNDASAGPHLARIGADGTLDGTFVGSGSPRVVALVPASDGTLWRLSEAELVRHSANGAADGVVNAGLDGRFNTLATAADGSAFVGGDFDPQGNGNRAYVARVGADGGLDANLNLTPNAAVQAIAFTPDGNILLGGAFTEVNGTPRTGLARAQMASSSNATPRLDITSGPNGTVVLSWPTQPGLVLETCALNENIWAPVPGPTATAADGRSSVTVSAADAGRLYRLRR